MLLFGEGIYPKVTTALNPKHPFVNHQEQLSVLLKSTFQTITVITVTLPAQLPHRTLAGSPSERPSQYSVPIPKHPIQKPTSLSHCLMVINRQPWSETSALVSSSVCH